GILKKGETCSVKVGYTSNYFDSSESATEDNAILTLSSSAGESEVLQRVAPGIYQSSEIRGQVETHYTLVAEVAGKTYQATSTLYAPVTIQEVSFEKTEGRPTQGGKTRFVPSLTFTDNPTQKNYYWVRFFADGIEDTEIYTLFEDSYLLLDGSIKFTALRRSFNAGELARLEVVPIDQNTFEYYQQLSNVLGSSMRGSSTPFNPHSNFGSAVMGFFLTVSSTSTEEIEMPQQ
ncbi:MAG: hypothetical protein RIS47_615, partial [Bacteroidota bacterium]